MTCSDCAASSERLHHGFRAACKGCQARDIARSPDYAESIKQGGPTDSYRRLCAALGVRHREVVAAFEADAINRLDSQIDTDIIPARPSQTRTA